MPGGTSIRNEIGLRRNLAATEAIPGVAETPKYRWYGDLAISKQQALIRTPEKTGTYDAFITPSREFPTFTGSYNENLTYQSLAQHLRYGLKGAPTSAAAGTGFSHIFTPTASEDDIASATLQYGVDGQVWRSTGVRHDEFTIAMDSDDADNVWKWTSNLFVREMDQVVGFSGTSTGGTVSTLVQTGAAWTVNQWTGAWVFLNFGTGSGQVRQVVSNTADTLTFYGPALPVAVSSGVVYRIEGLFTPGIAYTTYDSIRAQGTKFFLDTTGAIGTNQILDRLVSFNVTVANARTPKRFAENTTGYSARTGRGNRIISGQVRLEFDRRDEYQQFIDLANVKLRFEQTGPALSATPGDQMSARIDVNRAVWDVVDLDERENNITATFGFLAYLPPSDPILSVRVVNNISGATLAGQ